MDLNKLHQKKSSLEFWKTLGEWEYDAYSKYQKIEINKLLETLMEKVKYNFDLIYDRLIDNGYEFFDKKEARIHPTKDVEDRILKASNLVKKVGKIPLSLKKFYAIVGGVDFMKGYSSAISYPVSDILADPVVIPYLTDDFLDHIEYDFDPETWSPEDRADIFAEKGIAIAPDIYHKENISGGGPYEIKLSKKSKIDDFFPWGGYTYEVYNLTFIEYLRNAFIWGGFPGIAEELNKGNQDKKLLDFVNYLKKDLKEI